MTAYLIRRLLQSIVLLWLVSLATFFLIHSAPGGPAILVQPDVSREQAERLRAQLGLDEPLPVQYVKWLGNLVQGKLGRSYSQGVAVVTLIFERLPATLALAGVSLLLSVAIAIPLGIISALRPYSLLDQVATAAAFFGMAVPTFWLGIMLIIVFAVQLGWLPSAGMYTVGAGFDPLDRLRYIIMPAIVLSSAGIAQVTRYTRSTMLGVLHEDYMRTAVAKGLSQSQAIWRHGLKNALIPIVTVIGLLLPRLVSGAAITESVFAWPGMGRLAVEAAFQRDYPVIMGVTLLISAVVIASNLVTDLLYVALDPRVKLQ